MNRTPMTRNSLAGLFQARRWHDVDGRIFGMVAGSRVAYLPSDADAPLIAAAGVQQHCEFGFARAMEQLASREQGIAIALVTVGHAERSSDTSQLALEELFRTSDRTLAFRPSRGVISRAMEASGGGIVLSAPPVLALPDSILLLREEMETRRPFLAPGLDATRLLAA